MPEFLLGRGWRRDGWISTAAVPTPSNHDGVNLTMWIPPVIRFRWVAHPLQLGVGGAFCL
jgi:hypothetical protein